MITTQQARAVKEKLRKLYSFDKVGIGITKAGEDYAVSLLLYDWPDLAVFPDEVDGVKVITKIVGPIKAMDRDEDDY